ncbi:phosphosulfolactate synthase [Alicyclobacillus macrosporangiidus]|uniref:Phosphosulfolactate synthase n=1 Tax=Alicyclobacillus macrosporangiidus TaxID=392015 RepID=A0A1I7GS80_9BACL|nr:phosphosulfolactate synthase [Alicyclobacillus macrosporangiidus]SFU51116.1 phosphosulfolactate synthase [Alicyclobacillus macrosporangiidus]
MSKPYWSELLEDALPGRVDKPRLSGLTMVMDSGLSVAQMRGVLELGAAHIDFWKFGFASASVCPPERVMDKVSLCQEYGVLAYPGGTSLEIAVSQGIWRDYLEALWDGGIRVVEVSDGTIDLPLRTRREIIRAARKMGFIVLTEVGKKWSGYMLPPRQQASIIQGDLSTGAHYVIVEGREGGRGVNVYDEEGNVRESDVNALADALGPLSTRVIWEAPLTKQQVYYIQKFGHKVNFGNIPPSDVISLESLRRGLRSDTLRWALGISKPAEEASGEAGDNARSTGTMGHVPKPTLWTDRAVKPRTDSGPALR